MTNEITATENANAIQLANMEAVNQISAIISAEAGSVFTSVENDGTREAQSKVYNAMNNPDFRIADFINKQINVTDVLVEIKDIVDEDTGEVDRVPRIVLIDDKGKGYQATSIGMYTALRTAYIAFGKAPWNPPLEFTIKQKPTKNGSMLTAEIR